MENVGPLSAALRPHILSPPHPAKSCKMLLKQKRWDALIAINASHDDINDPRTDCIERRKLSKKEVYRN